MSSTYLYRLYDDAGQLLYVGISNNPVRRGHQHIDRQPWAHQVRRQEWSSPYPTRRAALDAERLAIIAEKPRYNVVHGEAHPVVVEEHKGIIAMDDMFAMLCPVCGFEYVDIAPLITFSGDFLLYGTCEQGCRFQINFSRHKGQTFLGGVEHDDTTGQSRQLFGEM